MCNTDIFVFLLLNTKSRKALGKQRRNHSGGSHVFPTAGLCQPKTTYKWKMDPIKILTLKFAVTLDFDNSNADDPAPRVVPGLLAHIGG